MKSTVSGGLLRVSEHYVASGHEIVDIEDAAVRSSRSNHKSTGKFSAMTPPQGAAKGGVMRNGVSKQSYLDCGNDKVLLRLNKASGEVRKPEKVTCLRFNCYT